MASDPRFALSAAHRRLGERARQVQAGAGEVPSPCQSVCRMDETSGLCVGCLRNLDEIASWSRLDAAARRQVWVSIGQRLGTTP